MSDWGKAILGVVTILFCAAAIAVWRLVAGKANKSDVEKGFTDMRSEILVQAAEGLRQYRELHAAIDEIKKEINALDKHSLTSGDLIELKADIKEVIKGQMEQVKLIDGMPDRLTSLEMTRNKQSEK